MSRCCWVDTRLQEPLPSAHFIEARRAQATEARRVKLQTLAEEWSLLKDDPEPSTEPEAPVQAAEPELSAQDAEEPAFSTQDAQEIEACFTRVRMSSMASIAGPDEDVDLLLTGFRSTSIAAARELSASIAEESEVAPLGEGTRNRNGSVLNAAAARDLSASIAEEPVGEGSPKRRNTIAEARRMNEAFDFVLARSTLDNYKDSTNVEARSALSAACVHLAEAAMAQKNGMLAKTLAVEAVTHAEAAKDADASNALGFIWCGSHPP